MKKIVPLFLVLFFLGCQNSSNEESVPEHLQMKAIKKSGQKNI